MSKEKMAELKTKIPARWLNFIEECYQVTGRDRDEDLLSWTKRHIEMSLDELDAKNFIRLVEKYQLSDIREIPQCIRDEAAGIPRKVSPQPKPETKARIKTLIEEDFRGELIEHFALKLQPDGVVSCRFYSGEMPEGYVELNDLNLDAENKVSVITNLLHSLLFGKTPGNSVDMAASSV